MEGTKWGLAGGTLRIEQRDHCVAIRIHWKSAGSIAVLMPVGYSLVLFAIAIGLAAIAAG